MTPEQIAAIPDPMDRAREATAFIARARQAITATTRVRDNAVVELRTERGLTQRQVATGVGLSPGRVAQIDASRGVTTRRAVTTDRAGATT